MLALTKVLLAAQAFGASVLIALTFKTRRAESRDGWIALKAAILNLLDLIDSSPGYVHVSPVAFPDMYHHTSWAGVLRDQMVVQDGSASHSPFSSELGSEDDLRVDEEPVLDMPDQDDHSQQDTPLSPPLPR